MITIQLTDKQMANIEKNMALCALILDGEPTATERDLAHAYSDLATSLAEAVLADGQMVMVGRDEQLVDNYDRPERHNINPANRPSEMQLEGYTQDRMDFDKALADMSPRNEITDEK